MCYTPECGRVSAIVVAPSDLISELTSPITAGSFPQYTIVQIHQQLEKPGTQTTYRWIFRDLEKNEIYRQIDTPNPTNLIVFSVS